MANIDEILNQSNPDFLAKTIAENHKKIRIKRQFTQNELAKRSGVTLSSLKRFEQKAEISLTNLLKLSVALGATTNFNQLFTEQRPDSIDEYLKEKNTKERKRVRKK
ncbi:MAG: helix-turn-helix transcriptional regulator [Bacteroidales bacterium]|nr:helix-turn-helix transcriptional regulator [Bacteroidales bacterium]